MVIWEATRSCALACRHCRASARPKPHPRELDFEASLDLIDQVVKARPQLFVVTGGDPMMRPDLLPLLQRATDAGLRVGLSPSATQRLANADFRAIHDTGVRRISLSLDGWNAETHDSFRGVRGAWRWTMMAWQKAKAAGMGVQINTTLTAGNIHHLDEFIELMDRLNPDVWTLFLMVPTGRGQMADVPDAGSVERAFLKLAKHAHHARYFIKTTEGQHFRRVLLQTGWKGVLPQPISDGKGFVFISHIGEIHPSGFLPTAAGNVRSDDLIDVYRHSPLFRALRDAGRLRGKCGRCEFKRLCGGSRARAFAMTGDYLSEDPLCAYQPRESLHELMPC